MTPRQPGSKGRGRGRSDSSGKPERSLAERLDAKALWYLERYDASVVKLRRALWRVVTDQDPEKRAEASEQIEALLQRFQGSGLLDDARYARSLALGLRSRGISARSIVARLRSRGVSEVHAKQALESIDADTSDSPRGAELEAARSFARRKRLGPHRAPEERQLKQQRDLAALARAGFSFDVARIVIRGDGTDDEIF